MGRNDTEVGVSTDHDTDVVARHANQNQNARKWVKRQWFTIAFLANLVVTFIAVLGCISSTTQKLFMFNVDVSNTIGNISSVSGIPSANLSYHGLPSKWAFGLSGLCELSSTGKATKCKYAYPPVYTLDQLVTDSLRGDSSQEAVDTISAWNEAVSVLKQRDYGNKTKGFPHIFRAAAACVILSLVTTFADLILTLLHPLIKRKYNYRPYPVTSLSIAVADSILLGLGAGLCYLSILYGPAQFSLINPGLADLGHDLGPAIPMLVLGAILLIGSVPVIGLVVFIIIPVVVAVVATIMAWLGFKIGVTYLKDVWTQQPVPIDDGTDTWQNIQGRR